MKPTYPTSVRFNLDDKRLLAKLAEQLNVSEREVLARALRLLAHQEGITSSRRRMSRSLTERSSTMRRYVALLMLMLLFSVTACVTTPQVSVKPPDKPKAAQQQDLVECQTMASQAAMNEGAWTTVAPARQAMFEVARDRWFLQCMESRGYVITTR